jgi:hypothetical protein
MQFVPHRDGILLRIRVGFRDVPVEKRFEKDVDFGRWLFDLLVKEDER